MDKEAGEHQRVRDRLQGPDGASYMDALNWQHLMASYCWQPHLLSAPSTAVDPSGLAAAHSCLPSLPIAAQLSSFMHAPPVALASIHDVAGAGSRDHAGRSPPKAGLGPVPVELGLGTGGAANPTAGASLEFYNRLASATAAAPAGTNPLLPLILASAGHTTGTNAALLAALTQSSAPRVPSTAADVLPRSMPAGPGATGNNMGLALELLMKWQQPGMVPPIKADLTPAVQPPLPSSALIQNQLLHPLPPAAPSSSVLSPSAASSSGLPQAPSIVDLHSGLLSKVPSWSDISHQSPGLSKASSWSHLSQLSNKHLAEVTWPSTGAMVQSASVPSIESAPAQVSANPNAPLFVKASPSGSNRQEPSSVGAPEPEVQAALPDASSSRAGKQPLQPEAQLQLCRLVCDVVKQSVKNLRLQSGSEAGPSSSGPEPMVPVSSVVRVILDALDVVKQRSEEVRRVVHQVDHQEHVPGSSSGTSGPSLILELKLMDSVVKLLNQSLERSTAEGKPSAPDRAPQAPPVVVNNNNLASLATPRVLPKMGMEGIPGVAGPLVPPASSQNRFPHSQTEANQMMEVAAFLAAARGKPLVNDDRANRVLRFKQKKLQRTFGNQVRYHSRKELAQTRQRVRGRFVSKQETAGNGVRFSSGSSLGILGSCSSEQGQDGRGGHR